MGYCIKYDDIRALLNTCSTQFNNWQSQLQNILSASNGIINMAAFRGSAAESVKSYMQEVHNILAPSISQAIAEFRSKLLLYSNGYYSIEADKYAEISEDALQAVLTKYDGCSRSFVDESCRLSSALNNVRDIVNVSPPSSYPVCGDYDTFKKRVSKLKDDVGSYERSKQGSDISDLGQLIRQLKATIKDFSSRSASSITYYKPGSFTSSASFASLYQQLNRSMAFCDSHVDEVQAAIDNETRVEKEIAAEERQKQAAWDIALSCLAIVVGAIVIVASAGTATPLVVAGIAGTMAYSTSNIIEDVQIINDPYTAAFNPIRDTVFMGNQTAYDIFGFASAMMVPVGMGIQSAAAANSSIVRAVGTTLAKQGLTMAAGYGADKAGEAMGLSPELRMLMSMGAMMATGYGVEAIDTKFNVSGYHVSNVGTHVPPEETIQDDVNKPYANSRPSYGKTQVEEVWENAKDPVTGKVYDPTGAEITWDKSKPRNGQWDMGHIPDQKYSDMHELYMNGTISKDEFLQWYRDPANYRPELPSTNRGHLYE